MTEYGCSMLEKKLKIYTTLTTTNMHMFTASQQLKKFDNIQEIIDEYYPIRYKLYQDRKAYILKQLERQMKILSNKVRFIKEQYDDIIDLRRKKKQVVINLLTVRKYDIIDEDQDYKYLRGMRIEDVEEENMKKLEDQYEEIIKQYKILQATTIEQTWLSELKAFECNYTKYIKLREDRIFGKKKLKKKKRKIKI